MQNGNGETFVVREIQEFLRARAFHGIEWIEGSKRFELADGTPVAQISAMEFALPSTGERLCKIPGSSDD